MTSNTPADLTEQMAKTLEQTRLLAGPTPEQRERAIEAAAAAHWNAYRRGDECYTREFAALPAVELGLQKSRMAAAIAAYEATLRASRAQQGEERYRHVESGGIYVLIGEARIQTDVPLNDLDEVVIYQTDGGGLFWARRKSEFYDGRFIKQVESKHMDSTTFDENAERLAASQQGEEPKWPPLVQLGRTIGLFASAIKSGEEWSDACQKEYDLANAALQTASGDRPADNNHADNLLAERRAQ